MTIAIIYNIDGKQECMLFGANGELESNGVKYPARDWEENAAEYEKWLEDNGRKVERVRVWGVSEPWIEGQKWASPTEMQQFLQYEGKGRVFGDWVFIPLDRNPDSKTHETAKFAPKAN